MCIFFGLGWGGGSGGQGVRCTGAMKQMRESSTKKCSSVQSFSVFKVIFSRTGTTEDTRQEDGTGNGNSNVHNLSRKSNDDSHV